MHIIDKIAWIALKEGRILSTRSRGKDTFYLPGGKREAGESDEQTLCREIREELGVEIVNGTLQLIGVFEAPAHGHPEGVQVRMTCYSAAYVGELQASSEIEAFAWLAYADRGVISEVDKLIFEHLRAQRLLA